MATWREKAFWLSPVAMAIGKVIPGLVLAGIAV